VGIAVVLILMNIIRKSYYIKLNKNLDPLEDFEKIYHNLCCYEFPWECFYGINFAFYRTFTAPYIACLYHTTKEIAEQTEKRVDDTDLIMHTWVDYGIDSPYGRNSWTHLNKIHGIYNLGKRNDEFVYVLSCFVADTIKFIDKFGWRKLEQFEKEAIYLFYMKVGARMNLTNLPKSLPEAIELVNKYVESDVTSKQLSQGKVLYDAVTALLSRWYWIIPKFISYRAVPAVLYLIGGPTFVKKMGIEANNFFILLVTFLGQIRGLIFSVLPPRIKPHLLSAKLMKRKYNLDEPAFNFEHVGPTNVLPRIYNL